MIDFGLIRIEVLLSVLIVIIFIVDLFAKNKTLLYPAAALGSLGLLACAFFFKNTGVTFFGSFISDDLSLLFKTVFLLNTFLVILVSRGFLAKNARYAGEYFILLLAATLGMLVMASSGDLLTFYISLELLSISSYILCAYQKNNPRSTEAGIKYLLLGAMASGILLFGMSMLFGAAGSLKFAEIAAAIGAAPSHLLYLGLVLVLAAMSFKIAVVPFHMWVPDVYEGAPAPVVAFLSVGTKIAGFAILIRLFMTAFASLNSSWGILMAALSAATILIGNLLAIPQTNIKRFMGYSSIAQAGYVIIGLAVATVNGVSSSVFYLVGYLFANLLAFTVIIIVSNHLGTSEIDGYKGLSRRSPILALSLLAALMSLGGVPPLVGFLGKLYLFSSAVAGGYLWLVVIGVIMSVVSIYYYLMILKRAYIEAPSDAAAIPLTAGEKLALGICMSGTILFGMFPSLIFDSIVNAVTLFIK